MPRSRVIIELSPSRVEVGVVKGRAVETWRSKRFPRSDWPQAQAEAPSAPAGAPGLPGMPSRGPLAAAAPTVDPFKAALTDSAEAIIAILRELEIERPGATVIYHARGSHAELSSCAASIATANAEQAARLALGNTADFPVDDAPVDTCTLLVDSATKGGESARQRHTLIAGDAEHRLAALHDLLSAADISVERMIPAEAVAIADAVRAATADAAEAPAVTAALFIGEHETTLAVGKPGRLIFVRTIASGTESIADALTRPLRPRAPTDPLVNLGHTQARALLLEVGVPTPDALIPSQPTLAGSALLPHLQPVLQRMAVELKQSLRFGVSEADRPNVRIVALGPGAAVPGLADAFARLSGFALAGGEHPVPVDAQDSSTGGLIAGFTRSTACSINLLPEPARAVVRRHALRRAMIAGALVALAYIGFEAVDSRARLAGVRSQIQRIQSQAQAEQGPALVRQRALEARQNLATVESRIRATLGDSPDAAAMWRSIAAQTAPDLRVLNLSLSRPSTSTGSDAEPSIALRAYIRLEDAPDPAARVKEYLDALGALPLVKAVRLGGAQRINVAGRDAQVFDATIVPVAFPHAGVNFEDAPTPDARSSHAGVQETRP